MLASSGYLNLQSLWFLLIAVLWIGFFVLEGFDFGTGMLYRFLGRDESERSAYLGPILPLWDGYEVWVIVAGGATFAAFPGWYATLFSGFYAAFLLLLLALIVRGVAIEYREKAHSPAWRRTWDVALPVACTLAAFLFGVAVANFVHGVPFDRHGNVSANLLDLLNGYAVLGGVTFLAVFALHGALFLSLRAQEREDLRDHARIVALRLWPVAAALLVAFVAWTAADAASGSAKQVVVVVLAAGAVVAAAAARPLAARRRRALAFAGSATAIVLLTAALFLWLYPRVLVSRTAGVPSPTVFTTAAGHYSLVAMTVIAAVFVPLALAYQSWAWRVFRIRLGREGAEQAPTPLDRLADTRLGRRPEPHG